MVAQNADSIYNRKTENCIYNHAWQVLSFWWVYLILIYMHQCNI